MGHTNPMTMTTSCKMLSYKEHGLNLLLHVSFLCRTYISYKNTQNNRKTNFILVYVSTHLYLFYKQDMLLFFEYA